MTEQVQEWDLLVDADEPVTLSESPLDGIVVMP